MVAGVVLPGFGAQGARRPQIILVVDLRASAKPASGRAPRGFPRALVTCPTLRPKNGVESAVLGVGGRHILPCAVDVRGRSLRR